MDYPEEAAGILSLHYLAAGEYEPTWRYARIAAMRAEGAYAHVEAANLYARALEASKQLPALDAHDLASVHRALGDVWYRASEYRKAGESYTAAQAFVTDEPVKRAALMLKLSYVEEKLGKYAEAFTYTERARSLLDGVAASEVAHLLGESSSWCAMLLQFEGRTTEALDWAEVAVKEAEAADDQDSLAEAYFVMGWAYGELGREGAQQMMERSLRAFEAAGNLVRQAGVLLSLGVVCQWEGRWDDALSFYERGRDANQKIGSAVGAALSRINIAEILTDRGEWAEAEAVLLDTMPLWKASQYRYYMAACLSLLGRVSLRLGRFDEAMTRLGEARANFLHVGAEEEVPAIDARIAETNVEANKLDEALAQITGLLTRISGSNAVSKVASLLQRAQAHALIRQGDLWGARDALEASLAAAREQANSFEAALTVLSLIELDRLEGVEPPLEMVSEARMVMSNLKVRAVPPVPLPAQ